MSIKKVLKNVEEKVVDRYQKIEDGVVNGYKTIENGAVDSFNKVTDFFVEKLFSKENEAVEETKERLKNGIK